MEQIKVESRSDHPARIDSKTQELNNSPESTLYWDFLRITLLTPNSHKHKPNPMQTEAKRKLCFSKPTHSDSFILFRTGKKKEGKS